MIIDRKLYENISSNSADVHDLSSLEYFRTDYFNKFTGIPRTVDGMEVLRKYIKNECTDKGLDRTF